MHVRRPGIIHRVATVLISDLHLGSAIDVDLARRPELLERLVSALEGAERLVLLGDLLELRERPVARVLERARPVLEALGAVMAGRRVTIVPGNHDYQLADPWLSRGRLESVALPLESEWPVEVSDGLAGRLVAWMPEAEVTLAYPGLWLRSDVYITHGHYLDLHLSVPRIESIAASLVGRITGGAEDPATPADYEAALAPLYALMFGLGQGARPDALNRGGGVSRRVWESVNGRGQSRWAAFLLGRVTIPGAVAGLNRAGLGPFRSDLSGAELRRAGLKAMGTVVERLGLDAGHVLFGHTHRPGPLEGDDRSEWTLPGGTRLWNTGSWLNERVFLRHEGRRSPYWPGTLARVAEHGEPELENVLGEATLPAL
jgi:predicted phosphodiesterase